MRRCKTRPATATRLTAAAALLAASLSCALAQESAPARTAEGKELFVRHCAPCHGPTAKGDGPVAEALKTPPPDLTKLRQPDGRFPAGRVFDVVGGDKVLPAHGSRTMPVWGVELRNRNGYSKSQQQLHLLVLYLESIQEDG